MKHYDYLIVGAGLFGATFAYEAMQHGKTCLVIDKREHIGGNCYTENMEGINVHKYGAHIFHTSNKETWDFINQFAEFNNYVNSPIAIYRYMGYGGPREEYYNLPFNMNTFQQVYPDTTHVKTPEEMKAFISARIDEYFEEHPRLDNLECQAISMVGPEIYEKLVKHYTQRQWNCKCSELPSWIIKRLPLRYTYNNNYFNDRYQGVPIGGYTQIIEKMLKGADIMLNYSFLEHSHELMGVADTIVYTGRIDEYYHHCLGMLNWRSLLFSNDKVDVANYQGCAVVNETGPLWNDSPSHTRTIEHKHFECLTEDKVNELPYTYITTEHSIDYQYGKYEPYYPINDERNTELYNQYKAIADTETNVIFGGRLGEYKYYDMAPTIEKARSYWK